jgi:hypothetical protein
MTTYAELAGTEVALPSATVYATFDGLFQQALVALHAKDPAALERLQQGVWQILPRLLVGFGSDAG